VTGAWKESFLSRLNQSWNCFRLEENGTFSTTPSPLPACALDIGRFITGFIKSEHGSNSYKLCFLGAISRSISVETAGTCYFVKRGLYVQLIAPARFALILHMT
jgi:hypothetical protein